MIFIELTTFTGKKFDAQWRHQITVDPMKNNQAAANPDLLRSKDAYRRMGVSKSTFYRLQQKGLFPRPAKLGDMSFWSDREVDRFIEELLTNGGRLRRASAEPLRSRSVRLIAG